MRPGLRAVLVGCGIEACLAATFAASGFGPCGPSNPIGFVGVIGHIPGLLIVEGLGHAVRIPGSAETGVMIGMQAIMFAALAYWIGARRRRRAIA